MPASIEPYTPNLVPQSGDIGELERFLADELARIAFSIRGSTVQSAYCALIIDTPQTGTANIAPQQFTGFTDFAPPQPNRITPLPPGYDQLNVLEDGVYYASCYFTIEIQSGREYNITLYVNGSPVGIFGTYDTSNQTDAITMQFLGLTSLKAGDEVTVWYNSTQNGSDFDVQSGIFTLHRISELLEVSP